MVNKDKVSDGVNGVPICVYVYVFYKCFWKKNSFVDTDNWTNKKQLLQYCIETLNQIKWNTATTTTTKTKNEPTRE